MVLTELWFIAKCSANGGSIFIYLLVQWWEACPFSAPWGFQNTTFLLSFLLPFTELLVSHLWYHQSLETLTSDLWSFLIQVLKLPWMTPVPLWMFNLFAFSSLRPLIPSFPTWSFHDSQDTNFCSSLVPLLLVPKNPKIP